MNISLLQIVLTVSSIVLLYVIINAWKNKRLRIFHAIVFAAGVSISLVLLFFPSVLQHIARVVGVERGSDFLVYMAIIFLIFVFFSLLQYVLAGQQEMTRLSTQLALQDYQSRVSYHDYQLLVPDPATPKDSYLFLIRAYNESSVLSGVVAEIIDAGFRHIVIVNDGSTDATRDVIDQLYHMYRGKATIIGLHHPINRGPGAANKTLFAFASRYAGQMGYKRCVTYDADGQMSIADMQSFMKAADTARYDVIIGSRFVQGAKIDHMPLVRRLILRGGRIVTYIFNGLRISDVSTGYRAYRVPILSSIVINSDRFSYQNDIVESLRQHNLRFIEIPVHIKYTDYSLGKGQSNLSAFKILIRLIYSSLFRG